MTNKQPTSDQLPNRNQIVVFSSLQSHPIFPIIKNKISNPKQEDIKEASLIKSINPMIIKTNSTAVVLLDQKKVVWILQKRFYRNQFVSLTDLFKIRGNQIFLGQNELIVQSNRNKKYFLIIWDGSKALIDFKETKLKKIPMESKYRLLQSNQKFQAYEFINESENKRLSQLNRSDEQQQKCWKKQFFFSQKSHKKYQANSEIYQTNDKQKMIRCYPSYSSLRIGQKVVGISVGKYHSLCWSVDGKLYSWGVKSFALGYESYAQVMLLPMPQNLYEQPSLVEGIYFFVKEAVAASQYSLALSDDGDLYQWGIKCQNQQVIFTPTPTQQIIHQHKIIKFIQIKSKNNSFAALSSDNNLFIWGNYSQNIIQGYIQEDAIKKDYLTPTLIPKENCCKIINFQITQKQLFILVSFQTQSFTNITKIEQKYFKNMVNSVVSKYMPNKSKFKQHKKSFTQNLDKIIEKNQSLEKERKTFDEIDRYVEERNSKRNYFESLKNENEILSAIMQPTRRSETSNSQRQYHNLFKKEMQLKYKRIQCRESARDKTSQININSSRSSRFRNPIEISSGIKEDYLHIQQFIKQFDQEKIVNFKSPHKTTTSSPVKHSSKQKKRYTMQKQIVIKNKMQRDTQKQEEVFQKIQKKSYNFIQKQLKIQEQNKRNEEEKQLIKNTLFSFILKSYLINTLNQPLDFGRQLKIILLMNNFSFNKIANNMKNILYKNRGHKFLSQLSRKNHILFIKLKHIFKKFVFKWRKSKKSLILKKIVPQIILKNCKRNLLNGVYLTNLYARKLQKLNKWHRFIINEKKNILRQVWKTFLLSFLKPNPSIIQRNQFPQKNIEMMSYKNIYLHEMKHNKNYKLNHFLKNSVICKLKLKDAVILMSFFNNNLIKSQSNSENEQSHKLKQISNDEVFEQNRQDVQKFRSTLHNTLQKKMDLKHLWHSQTDILLYSMHYQYFLRPKNYEINIPDNMRMSQKWINEEQKILQFSIKQLINSQLRQSLMKKNEYDFLLAHFIKENYEQISQKRWKFIIEYNKVKNAEDKMVENKNIRELNRLLTIIGKQILLNQDILPMKHKILDYAKQMKGAPPCPDNLLRFTKEDFKKKFKEYYQLVALKAKNIRRYHIS